MTLEQRIERAARALDAAAMERGGEDARITRVRARNILERGVPELFTDPPTHWLAPMEPTEAMSEAAGRVGYGFQLLTADPDALTWEQLKPSGRDIMRGRAGNAYHAMRKAYTSKDTAE